MLIHVYHAVTDDDDSDARYRLGARPTVEKVMQLVEEGRVRYVLVAKVECSPAEDAYRLTNGIDGNWWENPEVQPVFEGAGCRSTSCGDVLVRIEDAEALLVVTLGLDPIPHEQWEKALGPKAAPVSRNV